MNETNVRHAQWLPVVDLQGNHHTLSLQETLERAHELRDIADDGPIERSSLLRFLSSAAALVLRTGGTTRITAPSQWPAAAVAETLDALGDVFDLRHPSQPFAQEWDAPAPEKGGEPISRIRHYVPSGSTRNWHSPQAFEDRTHTNFADITINLLCRWFHAFGGNATSLYPVGMGNGTIGAKVGIDTAVFWQGPTLAQTLAANTPKNWVTSDALPAWADRRGQSATADYGDLWHATFNANALLLTWDAGKPVGFVRSRSAHQPPSAPSLDDMRASGSAGKKARDAVTVVYNSIKFADPHRFVITNQKGQAALFNGIRPEHGPFLNLRAWHQQALGSKLTGKVSASCARFDPHSLEWGIGAFAASNTTGTGSSPSYSRVDWVTLRAANYALPTPAAAFLEQTFDAVDQYLDTLSASLSWAGLTRDAFPYVGAQARARFYRNADSLVNAILQEARGGEPLAALRRSIIDAVVQAFDYTVEPLSEDRAFTARIIRARSILRGKLFNISKELYNT